MREIREIYINKFGSNGGSKVKVTIIANNFREPEIDFEKSFFRLTTVEAEKFGKWLIDTANNIKNDKDLKSE